MPLDPVKIPQNVYIEDRIVGPLTLRQTLIIAITGGISYAMYTSMVKAFGGNPGIVFTVAAWIPLLVGAAFALVKINDLSLTRLLLLAIEKSQKPSSRAFAPRRGITITVRTADMKTVEERNKQLLQEDMAAKQAQKKIAELSTLVDSAFVAEGGEGGDVTEGTEVTEVTTEEKQRPAPVQKNRIKVDRDLNLPELTDLSPFQEPPSPAPNHG